MRYCFFGSADEVAVLATYLIEQGGTERQAVDAGPILGCGVPDDQCLTKQHALPPLPGQEPGDAATVARAASAS
jgi:hypothetical protein